MIFQSSCSSSNMTFTLLLLRRNDYIHSLCVFESGLVWDYSQSYAMHFLILGHEKQCGFCIDFLGCFPGGASGKESGCQCRKCKKPEFHPWVGKIPSNRKWQSTPVFLPGNSHGQRSLAGCSPWGPKESDLTERLSTHTHTNIVFSVVTIF